MKSNKNPQLKTQIAIAKILLDGSKKTQNQIAKETDREKSTISHALDDLEKRNIIKRETEIKESGNRNKGSYKNKLCWLTYEVDNGSEVLRFFEDILKLKTLKQQETDNIILTLQKSNKILDIILEKYPSFCAPVSYEDRTQKEEDDFKNKLESSPTFFKMCLMNDSETVINVFTHMFWVFRAGVHSDDSYKQDEKTILNRLIERTRIKENCDNETFMMAPVNRVSLRNVGYKVCFFMDILNGSHDLMAV